MSSFPLRVDVKKKKKEKMYFLSRTTLLRVDKNYKLLVVNI